MLRTGSCSGTNFVSMEELRSSLAAVAERPHLKMPYMDLEQAKRLLTDGGYAIKAEERLGNNTGHCLRADERCDRQRVRQRHDQRAGKEHG